MTKIALHVIVKDRLEEVQHQIQSIATDDCPFNTVRYCDGHSSDGTWEFLKEQRKKDNPFSLELYRRKWDDDYAAQDNLLLRRAKSGEWILIQDSDEVPSTQLMKHLFGICVQSEKLGYDMIAVPALTVIDGQWECSPSVFIKEVREGIREPFRKNWLFKYEKGIKSFGSPHRELRKRTGRKGPFGKKEYRADFFSTQKDCPYPYIHHKSRWSIVLNDVLHAWIDPVGQEYTTKQRILMEEAVEKASKNVGYYIKTTEDLRHLLLSNETPRDQLIPLLEFAEQFKDEHHPIRNWYPVVLHAMYPNKEVDYWI